MGGNEKESKLNDMDVAQKISTSKEHLLERKSEPMPNQNQVFKTELEGDNEVPEVDTEAEGYFTVSLRKDTIRIESLFSGLSANYTASHIHKGLEAQNGKPIITLKPVVENDSTSDSWSTSYAIGKVQINMLKTDSLYMNVYSTKYTSGEIRGQISSPDM